MVSPLIHMDSRTLLSILFWGNLASAFVILSFRTLNNEPENRRVAVAFAAAKMSQAAAYFLIFNRGSLSDALSVNMGNSFLLCGFFLESLVKLDVMKIRGRAATAALMAAFALALAAFNAAERFTNAPNVRVAVASVCAFAVLAVPNAALIFARGAVSMRNAAGAFNAALLSLLLARAVSAFRSPAFDIFSNYSIQSATFFTLTILMAVGPLSFFLILKDDADRAIKRMATTDALTGLPNRYSFLSRANAVLERHKSAGSPVAVLFLDIDHFKKVNDIHGHRFGDAVLSAFAEIVAGCVRARDLTCRFGGEEIVVLLSGADYEQAAGAADRITRRVASRRFDELPDFSFTASAGLVSVTPGVCDTLRDLIDKADRALYEAKRTGRNKVVEYRSLDAGRSLGLTGQANSPGLKTAR